MLVTPWSRSDGPPLADARGGLSVVRTPAVQRWLHCNDGCSNVYDMNRPTVRAGVAIPVGPFRINLSRSGVSLSLRAGRVTANSRGRASVRLGHGLTWRGRLWR